MEKIDQLTEEIQNSVTDFISAQGLDLETLNCVIAKKKKLKEEIRVLTKQFDSNTEKIKLLHSLLVRN